MFFIILGTYTRWTFIIFSLVQRILLLIFRCHTVTHGTDLRRSPHYSLSPCLRFILVHMLVCPPKIRPTKVTHLERKSSLAYMSCEFPRPGRYISFLRKKLTSLGLGSSIISNVHQTSQ